MKAFATAEKTKKGNPEELFEDVYDKMPPNLLKQKEDMKEIVNMYKEHYPLEHYEKMS